MTRLKKGQQQHQAGHPNVTRTKKNPQRHLTRFSYREAEKKRLQEEAEAAAAAAKVLTEEEEEELANAPPPVLPYSSMFIFSSENGFRCAIHAIVTFPLFDVFIMLVIIASSIGSVMYRVPCYLLVSRRSENKKG